MAVLLGLATNSGIFGSRPAKIDGTATQMPTISPSAPYPRLLADVGGTYSRFGWIAGPDERITGVAAYPCREHAGIDGAIARYLAAQGCGAPAAGAIAIATPVAGDRVTMTNLEWTFSVEALRGRFGLERLLVLNDFAALALAIPALAPSEVRQVGGGKAVAGAPVALLGAGTGLGVSGLLHALSGVLPIAGEGGHVTLAAADAAEDRVIAWLRTRFGHVSAERVLSGDGLVNLYQAGCAIAGRKAEALQAVDVTSRALAASDAECRAAVEQFFAFLGAVAGDLALTLGARGGVYVGGGIVPHLGDWIARSAFRARFEAKGRYGSYLAAIPTWVIDGVAAPALRGANRALDDTPAGAYLATAS